MSMKVYKTWFVGNSQSWLVHAEDRKDALEKFALLQGVRVSAYIQCRLATETERYLLPDVMKVKVIG